MWFCQLCFFLDLIMMIIDQTIMLLLKTRTDLVSEKQGATKDICPYKESANRKLGKHVGAP